MKAKYAKTFEYGKSMAKTSLILAVVTCLAAMLLFPSGSIYQVILLIASVVLMVFTIYSMYRYCRCPYCGKRIMLGVLTVKSCPRCRRNLENGKKTKK